MWFYNFRLSIKIILFKWFFFNSSDPLVSVFVLYINFSPLKNESNNSFSIYFPEFLWGLNKIKVIFKETSLKSKKL